MITGIAAPANNRLQRTAMDRVPRHVGRRTAAGPERYAARLVAMVCFALTAHSAALGAEFLASVQLVNSGAILTCDYTRSSGLFLFTCRDSYSVFGLSCTSEPTSATGTEDFLCPVSAEPAVDGNALRLKCMAYSARDRDYFRAQAEQNPKSLVEGRVATHNCRSAKVDIE